MGTGDQDGIGNPFKEGQLEHDSFPDRGFTWGSMRRPGAAPFGHIRRIEQRWGALAAWAVVIDASLHAAGSTIPVLPFAQIAVVNCFGLPTAPGACHLAGQVIACWQLLLGHLRSEE